MPYTINRNYKIILEQLFDKSVDPKGKQKRIADLAKKGDSYIKNTAPVDTGFLMANTGCKVMGPYSILLYSDADYSGYVNDGTIYQNANPFFDRSENFILQDFMKIAKGQS